MLIVIYRNVCECAFYVCLLCLLYDSMNSGCELLWNNKLYSEKNKVVVYSNFILWNSVNCCFHGEVVRVQWLGFLNQVRVSPALLFQFWEQRLCHDYNAVVLVRCFWFSFQFFFFIFRSQLIDRVYIYINPVIYFINK